MTYCKPFKTDKNGNLILKNGQPIEVAAGVQLTKDYLYETLLKHTRDRFLFTYDDEDTDGYFIYNNTAYFFTYDFVMSTYNDWHRERPTINTTSTLGMYFATNNSMWEDENINFIPQKPIHIILYTDHIFIYDYNNFNLIYDNIFNPFTVRENISRFYMSLSTGANRNITYTTYIFEDYDGYYDVPNGSVPFELKRRNIQSTTYSELGFDIEVTKYEGLMREYNRRGKHRALFICIFDDKTYLWDISKIDFSHKEPYTKDAQASCSEDKGKKPKMFYSLSKDEALKIIDTVKPY